MIATRVEAPVCVHDVDVHHGWQSRAELDPYLPPVYRERFAETGVGSGVQMSGDNGVRGYREEALVDGKPPEGRQVVSGSPELTRRQLLDGAGVGWALLTGGQMYTMSCHPDVDYAASLVSAFNDFTVDRWLASDDRFRFALAVNTHDPEAAAAEIRRLGAHPQVVAVLLPAGATAPFGQRSYRPLHQACVELDLVLAIHYGAEGQGVNPAPTPVGYPSHYAEKVLARAGVLQAHLASLVFEGVFERFPTLKVALLEGGFGWVPPYLWYMDQSWAEVRVQTPWVKRPPSEYVLENVRFGARPFDSPMPSTAMVDTLEWMQADRTLFFASDYPRWDWTAPSAAFGAAPQVLRDEIFDDRRGFFRA